MQFQKKEKRQTTVRFDSHHVRLRTGEIQRKTGSYMYRWTDKLGKRNTIYAATLEDLREQEEQILVDQHDGIKANIKNVTVNDVYELWCQLKRGIKDSTMKNYIYMYELFVKPKAGIREIPMTEGVKQAFLMEKEFQEECGMKSVSHIEGYSDFVFVNRNGEVQHQGTLNKALQRIMRDCNSEVLEKKGVDSDPVLLPKFSCHVLRHTFATRMCESGLNVKVVQSVLGHADVTTTLDIYVTVTNDLKKREITAFETYLKTGAKQMANV